MGYTAVSSQQPAPHAWHYFYLEVSCKWENTIMTVLSPTPEMTRQHNGHTPKDIKYVYLFNEVETAEKYVGGAWDNVRALLGGKGANLADMTRLGVPVPPGRASRER